VKAREKNGSAGRAEFHLLNMGPEMRLGSCSPSGSLLWEWELAALRFGCNPKAFQLVTRFKTHYLDSGQAALASIGVGRTFFVASSLGAVSLSPGGDGGRRSPEHLAQSAHVVFCASAAPVGSPSMWM
jgi:hypothetical protein